MAIVRVDDLRIFLSELEKDRPYVDRRIVRIEEVTGTSRWTSGIQEVRFVATARVGPDILRFESLCGHTCGVSENDARVEAAALTLTRVLRDGCLELGLELRPGVLDE